MKKNIVLLLMFAFVFACKENQKQKDIETQDEIESTTDRDINPTETRQTETRSTPASSPNDVDFEQEVQNFITCKKAATERNDCRNSITKVITKMHELTEFNDPKLGYVVYDSIRPIAERSKHWLQLGTINQESIQQALEHSERGGLSLIIDTSETYGHVVMIIPGETTKSGSWGMELPNVLSLTNYKPEKSFYNKSLAYAMQKSDALKIFLRQ
ncbi:hypothetical protein [Aquimarina aquimarini]|uniref:hypothetical protein n=1 Tax=Aquimarina aquimarini TaxID=1191734 RepID=UPI00131EEFCE|nr:hypothetical protein [Aquimarina aquimarini]